MPPCPARSGQGERRKSMTTGTLGAASAALHSNIQSNGFRASTAMLSLLLSSVATAAFAQTPPSPSNGAIVPGSTNTSQQEQTNSNAPATPSPMPPAPQADD